MDATVTVTDTRFVGPDTVALTFETPEGFSARPGQFVKLSATVDDEGYSRFYTLSSPDVEDTFEVTVGVSEEGGPFSAFLADLDAGDDLDMSGPFGKSFYEDEERVVVLAGGPGIGPAVGIAERALGDGHDAAVVYLDDDPAHHDRLESLAALGATIVVDDPEADLSAHLRDVLDDPEGDQVFVYGFADFVARAEVALADAGADPDGAKIESFG